MIHLYFEYHLVLSLDITLQSAIAKLYVRQLSMANSTQKKMKFIYLDKGPFNLKFRSNSCSLDNPYSLRIYHVCILILHLHLKKAKTAMYY